MHRLILKCDLLDDVVVNERGISEGGHAGLDYLPGRLFLGAAAARLYRQLSSHDAYTLFHSGRVRFGDALPYVDATPCWPMPLCWHEQKGLPATQEGWLQGDRICNYQHSRFKDGIQPKQLRTGYVRADGYHCRISQSFRMKTALDHNTGKASEAQLFGYESIGAGQTFISAIEADAEVPEALWQQLVTALSQDYELLLGRSRSAEYGRVHVTPLSAEEAPKLYPDSHPADTTQSLSVWCLADLALQDAYGQPTLAPTPQAFGLDDAEIDWQHSFLRFRRYTSWNAYRNGYDLERQVICRGSVITLRLHKPVTAETLDKLRAGVGMFRELGLGQVSVNPRLLAKETPEFAPAIRLATAVSAPSHPEPPLIAWLKAQHTEDDQRRHAEKVASAQQERLKECYRLARIYAGVPEHLAIGPSPAQWGSIYEAARNADTDDFNALKKLLFADATMPAVCRQEGEGWQDEFCDTQDNKIRSFYRWFKDLVDELASVQALRFFARNALRTAQGQHRQRSPGAVPTQEHV